MKKLLLPAVIILGLFACQKDPCKKVKCNTGGACIDGRCNYTVKYMVTADSGIMMSYRIADSFHDLKWPNDTFEIEFEAKNGQDLWLTGENADIKIFISG